MAPAHAYPYGNQQERNEPMSTLNNNGMYAQLGSELRAKAPACSSFCHPEESCSLTGSGICDALSDASADDLICWLEDRKYGWSLDHTGRLIEARIWVWPNVVGRYRPTTVEPLADMLRGAMRTMTREQLRRTNTNLCGKPSR